MLNEIYLCLLQLNNLERAVSAAYTFLQKNPEDPYLTKNMNYYKTLFEVDEYLIDLEERPYEVQYQHLGVTIRLLLTTSMLSFCSCVNN